MEVKKHQEHADEILRNMLGNRGFDVRNCRMSQLQRRVSRRIDVLGISSLTEYSEYLEANPDEYEILFNTILVDITRFYRDPEAWNFLRENVLPDILKKTDEIRIWSAGCSSGEEPYSVAIMLAEMLGDDLAKRTVRIYATDIDETALKFARAGTYTFDQLAEMSEDVREKYFTHRGHVYTIAQHLRKLLIFSRHNLLSQPPIPHIDLLLCRNVLIYFDRALQSRIISRLQYALNDAGYLWLGKAEAPIIDIRGLKPLNAKWRILKRMPSTNYLQRGSEDYIISYAEADFMNTDKEPEKTTQKIRTGFIMLDSDLNVTDHNQTLQEIWGLQSEQLSGKPFSDLNISYCPVDLKHRIEKVIASQESLVIEDVEYWVTKEKRLYLRIEIIPAASNIVIFLEDITEQYETKKELQIRNKALEAYSEMLLSANEKLRDANMQLQSINQELQSTNAELESMNEEIRSTSRII